MTSDTEKEQYKAFFRDYVDAIYVKKNLDAIDQYIAEDFVEYVPFDAPQGRAGFRETMQKFFDAFPDLTTEIGHIMADGNKVIGRLHFTGTHRGEYELVPPTGKQIVAFGLDIVQIDDGKISQRWVFRDDLSFLRQMGMMA